jgi:hypothetical protein
LIVRARAEYMQIGNANFTWFGTTASKSRRNVLGLRRAGHGDYVFNSGARSPKCARRRWPLV